MEGEIGTGLKLAIGLGLLAVIIVIVYNILPIIKGGASQGTTQIANGMDAMLASEFDDFNQKQVNGNKVSNTITIYNGRPISIIVGTLKANGGAATGNQGYCYNAVLAGASGGANSATLRKIDLGDRGTSPFFVEKSLSTNASGTVEYNTSTTALNDPTSDSYVKSTAKFDSTLVKDSNDVVIGIYFRQIKLQ